MDIGFAAKIVTIIIKSIANSKIGSGLGKELMGTSIDGVSEKSITEINNFINGKKSKIKHALSDENLKLMHISENNIEFVRKEMEDLLQVINVTDELFRKSRYKEQNLSELLWENYRVPKNYNIDDVSDIKKGLYVVAQVLIALECDSEEFEKKLLKHISGSVDDINKEVVRISNYMQKNYGKMDDDIQMILVIVQMILEQIQNFGIEKQKMQRKIESRTQEYADKWNQNMFLNDFDKRDENAGINVKLSEVYLEEHLPYYIWGDSKKARDDLKELLSEYVNEKKDSKMLLILGQPGIGKSTLITWIAANFFDRIDDILVYKFASDLGKIDWKESRVSNSILEELGLDYSDLNGKVLILDGFDEVSVENNGRRDILDSLYGDWIYNERIKNFSLIVTCRENYVQRFAVLKCKFITLQPWDKAQIKSFCNIFQGKTKNSISESTIEKVSKNREILGVPLILYMVLALDISIEKEGSIVDVYDKIFSLEGGIYDRCIDNKSFAEPHRIVEVKKQIHQVSREIAIWMFENNPKEASIPQEEYKKICNNIVGEQQKGREVQQDFLIGNFFKLKHCEGIETEELYFVHRTIYEYFVVETIYSSIESAMIKLADESQEELAGKIVNYLKQGWITITIGEYLQYKILKFYNSFCDGKGDEFYLWWEGAIEKLIGNGMFYYTKNVQQYKNILDKEMLCFLNLVKILRLVLKTSKREYVLKNVNKVQLEKYIRFRLAQCRMEERQGAEIFNLSKISLENINLSGADLKMANLQGANLCNANLRKTDLSGQNLQGASLQGANLEEVNLKKANLKGADLTLVNLRGANLQDTIFDECQICYLRGKCNLNNSYVYVFNEKKVISYESYRKRIGE